MPLSSKALARFGFSIRTAMVVLYIAVAIAGFCVLRSKQMDPSKLRYIATRDLPAGYQLQASDFEFDPPVPPGERNRLPTWLDPTGHYVIDHHPKNTLLAQSDLISTPVIKAGKDEKGKDMVSYWFPLQKQAALARVLNADSRVDICFGTCIAQNVRVLSIVCGAATTPIDCYAALELSTDSSANLASEKKDYRLILRGDSTR
jgi:hypothetical protein